MRNIGFAFLKIIWYNKKNFWKVFEIMDIIKDKKTITKKGGFENSFWPLLLFTEQPEYWGIISCDPTGSRGRFLHVPQRSKGHQEASPQYRAESRDECMSDNPSSARLSDVLWGTYLNLLCKVRASLDWIQSRSFASASRRVTWDTSPFPTQRSG